MLASNSAVMTSSRMSRPLCSRPCLLPAVVHSRKRVVQCNALGGPEFRVRKTLPIFPLSVVALPAATVPLIIFEARYRVLFNTLLSGMDGIEEGLVQKESDYCGTKRFGMCYVDKDGRMASIGTTLEIMEFTNVPDGRLLVNSKGREKFRVINVVKEKPVLLCEVEVIPEEGESEETHVLAQEVADLLRNTIRLNMKMQNAMATDEQLELEELAALGPRDMSYWVASFFSDVQLLQQNLLEEDSTVKRLTKEKELLTETVRYYTAAVALKGAFNSSSEPAGEAEAEAGGSSEGSSKKSD